MAVPTATDSAAGPLPPGPADSAAEPVLEFRGVTKRFGGATALDRVDFELLPGEIHGLVGENGAGKSTLMKILSGVHTPDEGQMALRGEVTAFASPADAKARGIGMIYQELSSMPALTVAENVFLGSQPTTRAGAIDWKRMRREASDHLAALGIDVDVSAPAKSLSLGGQQLVEIARVVFSGASIIVLDEPTSALSAPEAQRLFRVMGELKSRGKSLVFISHFLEDVLAVSDRITVLKNARKVATLEKRGLTKQQLIQLMIGHDADALAESYEGGVTLPAPSPARPMLEVAGLSRERRLQRRLLRRQTGRDSRHFRQSRGGDDRGGPRVVRPRARHLGNRASGGPADRAEIDA